MCVRLWTKSATVNPWIFMHLVSSPRLKRWAKRRTHLEASHLLFFTDLPRPQDRQRALEQHHGVSEGLRCVSRRGKSMRLSLTICCSIVALAPRSWKQSTKDTRSRLRGHNSGQRRSKIHDHSPDKKLNLVVWWKILLDLIFVITLTFINVFAKEHVQYSMVYWTAVPSSWMAILYPFIKSSDFTWVSMIRSLRDCYCRTKVTLKMQICKDGDNLNAS